jgi:hypothetical protein
MTRMVVSVSSGKTLAKRIAIRDRVAEALVELAQIHREHAAHDQVHGQTRRGAQFGTKGPGNP